jgi:NAD(P)-dependent dehydrogenase (short-subunit alcohol dehydrogenase family)
MGKKILLIGGSTGLGQALAEQLSWDNEVVCLSRQSDSPLDLRWDEPEIAAATKRGIDRLGGTLDSLVVSSGMGAYYAPLTSVNMAKDIMQVNYFGPVVVFKSCLKALLLSRGNACFITSTVARKPGAGGLGYYAASKGAVHSWITSEARRVGEKGISMFAVCPGWFDSPMTEELHPKIKEKAAAAIPFKRFGSPGEIASFTAALLSQSNWTTNGSIYECSGGA